MEEIKPIRARLVRNRAGILAQVKTCQRAAVYYSDGEWKDTTTTIKFIKNR
jgi:hypothetical protein